MNRISSVATALVLAGIVVPAGHAQQPPVFKGGTEVIALDVNVVDANGRPVTDLGVTDFLVKVDGEPRTVRSVQFVSRQTAPTASDASPLLTSSHYSSNQWVTAERTIVLVIDQGSLVAGGPRTIIKGATDFLERLNPADRVALVTIPGGGPFVDFTTDRKKLRDGISKVRGVAVQANETLATDELEGKEQVQCTTVAGLTHCSNKSVPGAEFNLSELRQTASNTAGALQRLLLRLAGIPGQKTVVLASAGLVSGSARNPEALFKAEDLRTVAAMAGASVYVLHLQDRGRLAEGPVNNDEAARRVGLDLLARETGGAVFPVTGSGEAAFTRIATETSGYYLLGLVPAAADRDARAHLLKVQVTRNDLTVRARGSLLLGPPSTVSRSVDEDLLELLKTSRPKGLLPLTVGTYRYADASGAQRVLIAAGMDRGVTTPAPYSIGYLVLDAAGKIVASAVDEATVQVVGTGVHSRHQYTTAPALAAGSYVLRIGAIDASGRRGMVEHRFTIETPTATNQLLSSDLLLFDGARSTTAAPAPLPDGIVSGDRLGLHLKLKGSALPNGTRVTMTVSKGTDGPPLAEAAGTLATEVESGDTLVDAVLPVAELPPDDYLARAEIVVPGQAPVTLARPFRRVVSK